MRKQQGIPLSNTWRRLAKRVTDLQAQYTNFKNTLQTLAQKVGEIEQEVEEHKCVPCLLNFSLHSRFDAVPLLFGR